MFGRFHRNHPRWYSLFIVLIVVINTTERLIGRYISKPIGAIIVIVLILDLLFTIEELAD